MVWNKLEFRTAVVACLVALTLAVNDFSHARFYGNQSPQTPLEFWNLLEAPLDQEDIDKGDATSRRSGKSRLRGYRCDVGLDGYLTDPNRAS